MYRGKSNDTARAHRFVGAWLRLAATKKGAKALAIGTREDIIMLDKAPNGKVPGGMIGLLCFVLTVLALPSSRSCGLKLRTRCFDVS
jgi:hypothetical protein